MPEHDLTVYAGFVLWEHRRRTSDGSWRDLKDCINCFGPKWEKEWGASTDYTETRVARDGQFYSAHVFNQHYGNRALWEWEEAGKRMSPRCERL